PKCLVFVPILLVSLLLDYREHKRLPVSLLACAAGGVAGVLPLYAWLSANGLVAEFVRWVFQFNSQERGLQLGGVLPLAVVLVVGIWVWSIRGEAWRRRDRVITAAALASGLWSFWGQPAAIRFIYNLQILLLITAVVAPAAMVALRRLAPAKATWPVMVVIVVLPLLSLFPGLQHGTYLVGRQEIARLQELSGGEPVLAQGCHHPLFSRDVVDLSLSWHWIWLANPALHQRVEGMADTLMRVRPPLISSTLATHGGLCGYLLETDTITATDAVRLQAFLDRDYRLAVMPTGWPFWVRKDRPLRASELLVVPKQGLEPQ
ncbi:MAG: hypothetical protein WCP21_14165, partial [Armatimonadota bacterium]